MATEEVVGTVRPRLAASIQAKMTGVIQVMAVAPGQQVKTGDLLAQLDARETQARLDQASAVREQSKKDMERLEILVKEGAVTRQEYDAALARFRVADATVAEMQTTLGYAKIVAPFDGVITAKHADVGDLAAPGKALLDMEDPGTVRFEADVSEGLIDKIKMGDALSVRLSANGAPIDGVVSELTPVADPASRTFRIKIDLPKNAGLRSGQFGRVAVPVADVSAIRVPATAVLVRGQMEIVFVVANQRAQLRLVKTGKQLGSELEIVSGLNSGDQIVVTDADKLVDGQAIDLK
jgi:RND family efflux transporter MFP subunit